MLKLTGPTSAKIYFKCNIVKNYRNSSYNHLTDSAWSRMPAGFVSMSRVKALTRSSLRIALFRNMMLKVDQPLCMT